MVEEKKLTDEEIVKDIERSTGMPSYWKKVVLDLIHRQKAEIERLTKLYDETSSELFDRNIELEDCEKSNKSLQTMNFNLLQENTELIEKIERLTEENGQIFDKIYDFIEFRQKRMVEPYKDALTYILRELKEEFGGKNETV